MNRTNVQKLTDALRAMEVAMEDVKQAASAVMNQPDNTTTREQFKSDMYLTLTDYINKHIPQAWQVRDCVTQLDAVLYFRDLEAERGRNGFREIYDANKHMVKAVIELRTGFPELSVSEAKLVVEAYRDGFFK